MGIGVRNGTLGATSPLPLQDGSLCVNTARFSVADLYDARNLGCYSERRTRYCREEEC